MDVSPNALRKATVEVLKKVNSELETASGERMAILLLAEAQCLNTLTLLRDK